MAAPSTTIVDTQHSDIVHDTQFDYYGRLLATCSSDRAVKVFAVTGQDQERLPVATLEGHEGPVWMLSWAHPKCGVALASCSYDQRAIVWKYMGDTNSVTIPNAAEWKPAHIVTAHTSSVNAVAWAPVHVGMALATAGSDGQVFVSSCIAPNQWHVDNVAAGQSTQTAHPMGAMAVSFAPSQRVMLASGGGDNAVKVWVPVADDAQKRWELAYSFTEHSDWVRDVAFSPDAAGRHVVLASCSQDKTVVIRRAATDVADDQQLTWEVSPAVTFAEPVWRLSWSPCGTMLLVTTGDSQAFVLKPGATFGDEWLSTPVTNSASPME